MKHLIKKGMPDVNSAESPMSPPLLTLAAIVARNSDTKKVIDRYKKQKHGVIMFLSTLPASNPECLRRKNSAIHIIECDEDVPSEYLIDAFLSNLIHRHIFEDGLQIIEICTMHRISKVYDAMASGGFEFTEGELNRFK